MVFKTAFPNVVKCIEEVELFSCGDSLVWSSYVDGYLSFKDAYDVSCSHGDFKWAVSLWQSFIPPRRSILIFQVIQR